MEQGFVDLLKQLTKEQGKIALMDHRKFKALISDYTKNQFKKESAWLTQAAEAGAAKAIDGASDLSSCKKAMIRDLEEEKGLSPAVAADIVNTLAFVLRGDLTRTLSPSSEKAAAEASAIAAAQAAAKASAAAEASLKEKLEAEKKARLDAEAKARAAEAARQSSPPASGTKTQKITTDKGVYEGDVANGKPHGKGKMKYKNGAFYEGDWVNGKCHGKGKLIWNDGSSVYEGDFADDAQNGKGKLNHFGDKYEGDFVNGYKHGRGRMVYSTGRVFEGKFVNDFAKE